MENLLNTEAEILFLYLFCEKYANFEFGTCNSQKSWNRDKKEICVLRKL